ncbi:hypothetical protein D7Y21_09725 [Corallococcus sp. AB045]|nr:hypothetical protein D7Y21_09725 [Corallococcus sp. AB045]
MVSKAQYDLADKIRQEWANRGEYQLVEQDCATFVGAVGTALGLCVPERDRVTASTWFPARFIEAVIAANDQSQFLNGLWESTDPKRRWLLEITGAGCVMTERVGANAELRRSVTVERSASDVRVSRSNDRETLLALGARPRVVDAIVQGAPTPSYMTLRRTDASSLIGIWNGISWDLDMKGNLQRVHEPGSRFRTEYSFARR